EPAVAMLVSAMTVLLLILMDFPLYLISALARSYSDLPIAAMPNAAVMLRNVTTTLSAAFIVGAQISAPFVVYSVIINAMFGILGRLVPQLPSYFVSVPFVALGGLALLLIVLGQMLLVMSGAISRLALPQ
ncbi:flagellar biosynthetic protein FliR, partial [Pseudorhodoplanes sp.]|uniref:flagellar biosynthetic protein FliR n=1 Tax=Pseudorhodoplanes sp. TaxID=1934341 RepID=UPI003D0D8FA6